MKIIVLIIFLFSFSTCSTFYSNDEKFSINNKLFIGATPNPNLIGGVYVNRLDSDHDTLILPSNIEFGPSFGLFSFWHQMFFFLTRDTSDRDLLIHGTLSYSMWTEEDGDSTGYLSFYPTGKKTADWTSRVYFRDSSKTIKVLVITDFLEHKIRRDPLKIHLTGDRIEYYEPSSLTNSRGIPFRFEKIIYLLSPE